MKRSSKHPLPFPATHYIPAVLMRKGQGLRLKAKIFW